MTHPLLEQSLHLGSLHQPPKLITPSPVFFSVDLISEVFSFLPVKSLLRFKSVSKSWKTFISDPNFVKSHLNKSQTLNPQFTLITNHIQTVLGSVIPYPISHLIENPSFTLSIDPYYSLNDKECSGVVGSCNGLICLFGYSFTRLYAEYWLRLWNPATRKISLKFGHFCEFSRYENNTFQSDGVFNFKFGCDSSGTYKVVASRYNCYELRSNVRVLNLGGNVWRDIESFTVLPLHLDYTEYYSNIDEGVHLSGTLNWLAIHNYDGVYYYKDITVEQFVIVSLDLGTKTYNQYKFPCGFDEVPPGIPTIGVLGGYLCFSYRYKETDFVIWQMMEFGVEESWTQFLKISFQNLQLDYDFSSDMLKLYLGLWPLFLSEDGDTLILYSTKEYHAILYNWRDNIVKRTSVNETRTTKICWYMARGYVESLVWIW